MCRYRMFNITKNMEFYCLYAVHTSIPTNTYRINKQTTQLSCNLFLPTDFFFGQISRICRLHTRLYKFQVRTAVELSFSHMVNPLAREIVKCLLPVPLNRDISEQPKNYATIHKNLCVSFLHSGLKGKTQK